MIQVCRLNLSLIIIVFNDNIKYRFVVHTNDKNVIGV